MTVKGGTTPACAACKHQRRKCSSDCLLAPYFPATEPRTFQNAHRLFGVSNIVKTLKQIDSEDDDKKADAMKSIIFEADMRARFPVNGCVEYIAYLRHQIALAEHELGLTRAHLARCRQQQHQILMKSFESSSSYDDSNCYYNDKAPFGLDPATCYEYNSLTSSPLAFSCYDLMMMMQNTDRPPGETSKENHGLSLNPTSSSCDLKNAAASLSLTRNE